MSAFLRQSGALLLAALASAVFLVLPVPPASATTCGSYQRLIDAGYPGRALGLIDSEAARRPRTRPPVCALERSNAEEAVANVEAVMAELDEAKPQKDQLKIVDSALAIDRENIRALTKKIALTASPPPDPAECSTYAGLIEAGHPERVLALLDEQKKRLPNDSTVSCGAQLALAEQAIAAAELDAAKVPTGQFSANWTTFWDKQLVPSKDGVLALIGWLLGAVIALKLMTRLLRNALMPACGSFRRIGTTLALVGVVVGGLIGVRGNWMYVLGGVVITLISLLLLVAYRRTRARLDIVTSGSKAPSAEHVRVVLHEMGRGRSGGLEMPTASDASFLKDVVVLPDSTGAIGKSVAALLGMLTPYSPWRLSIAAESDDVVNVELYRNYERVDAAVLDRANLLLFLEDAVGTELTAQGAHDGEDVAHDFAIVAGAMALTAMAQAHGFKHVLGGASKWRSVGLEYLARQMSVRNALRGRLLAEAVDVDPRNDSAWLALWHHRYRYDDSVQALQDYWELSRGVADREKLTVVGLGARYAQVVAGVNLRSVLQARLEISVQNLEEEGAPTGEQVRAAAESLVTEIETVMGEQLNRRQSQKPRHQDLCDLAEDMEWSARTLAWSAGYITPGQDGSPAEVEAVNRFSWGITPNYNAACYWADREHPDVDKAIRALVLAGETDASEWLHKDPQLRRLRTEGKFRRTFGGTPRQDLLALMPFAPYAAGLRTFGLTSAYLIATASSSALEAAGVPFGLRTSVKQAGAFAVEMPEQLANLQVEILDALDNAGYRFARPAFEKRDQVQKSIVAACQRFKTNLDEGALSRFLNR